MFSFEVCAYLFKVKLKILGFGPDADIGEKRRFEIGSIEKKSFPWYTKNPNLMKPLHLTQPITLDSGNDVTKSTP